MEDRATIILNLTERNEQHDLDIPLDITTADLLYALNSAYDLGIDTDDPMSLYVKSENPIVLLHGQKTLGQLGLRNGSVINI